MKYRFAPGYELLEDRTLPSGLIASQLPLATLPPLTLTMGQVEQLLERAAAATSTDNAIVAVVDRAGDILGVSVEKNVSTLITNSPDPQLLGFAIDGAVSEARTAAFFSSNADPLTSRTVQFISQTTDTQREVDSYTFISNPQSALGGPGLVSPIEIGGNFPPNVADTPQVDLFGIETTNREMLVNPGANGILFTPGDGSAAGTINGPYPYTGAPDTNEDVGLMDSYNITPAFIPAGQGITSALSYYDTVLPPGEQNDPSIPHVASRGIGTLPGGIPLYEDGVLVGGIGVFFPGTTGFADQENSALSSTYNPNLPDLSMEAEFIAFAAAGGSTQAGFQVGTLGGVPALPGFNLPDPRIDLVGITLNTVGPGGLQGPTNLVKYIKSHFSVGTGAPYSSTYEEVDFAGDKFLNGKPAPQGMLVTPHAGGGLSAAEVQQIINQGIAQANATRAQLRPLGSTTKMIIAVTDSDGEVLGLYRMPDAPIFSIDVAISKARDASFYDDSSSNISPLDRLAGIPAGTAFTARTFRYLALPYFPEGVNGSPPGPWSILTDPGTNGHTATIVGAAQAIDAFNSVFGYDAFHPNTTFRPANPATTTYNFANSSGIVFFPGSSAVYVNGKIVGGLGVSGDGVDEDDVVTTGAIIHFAPPLNIQVDQYFFHNVRLPYAKFDRNPEG